MDYIVACHDPELLQALCAFADQLAPLPDPRDPRGVRHALPVLLATLLVALAGGANSMAAVAAFTHDHQAWFRLWLPLGRNTPSRDTYLRLVHRLDPETAVKAALRLQDGTSLPGLRRLILALDGKVARRSGDPAACPRPLLLVSAFLVREGLTQTRPQMSHPPWRLPGAGGADPGPGAVRGQGQRNHGHPPPARPHGPGGGRRHH